MGAVSRLIINADDFGLTAGVNRAIIECFRLGVVTSATLMVNARAAADAAARAAECPALGVGLHVNLTSGEPVLGAGAVPSLVGADGAFPGVAAMAFRITTGLARAAEVEAEISAQLDECRRLGVEPTHVDSHHHLHALPRLRAVLAPACRHHGVGKSRGYRMRPRSLKSLAIRLAAAAPAGERLRSPDRFAGIEEMGERDMAAALARELAVGAGSLEFMCHPGYADRELARASTYAGPRELELQALTSAPFAAVLRQSGARQISFRDL